MKEYQINGQTYPFCFSMQAIYEFIELKGSSNDNLKLFALGAWIGFKHGHRLAGKKFLYSISDVTNWMDQDFDMFAEISNDMSQKLQKFNQSHNNRH